MLKNWLLAMPVTSFVIIVVFYLTTNFLYAQNSYFFYDDFDKKREMWSYSKNWDLVEYEVENVFLQVKFNEQSSFETAFPLRQDVYQLSDYEVGVKMYGKSGVDQDILVRVSQDKMDYYIIDLRAAEGGFDGNNIRILKVVGGHPNEININDWAEVTGSLDGLIFRETWLEIKPSRIGCSILNNLWYELNVNLKNEEIFLSIKCPGSNNFVEIVSVRDKSANPLLKGGIGLASWSGTYPRVNRYVEKSFDNVFVINHQLQKKSNPVIFVPGLMASWNTKAIIFGEEVDPDDWRLIPFAEPVYRRLKESILLNGYEEGIDFYVWPYDWRQPIEVSHQKLKEFIDSLDMPVDQKINLIGHSLGGMVSRSMAQSYPELVDKVITVGSPHQGAVQAYQALAGGKVGEKQDLQWIGLQLLIHLHRRGFQTDAEVVRNIAPVLYNLLPTFQFLEKNNSPFVSSNFTNYYLNELNNSDSTPIFIDKTNFLVGNKPNSTPEKLKLGKRSVIDKALNLWPDGTPIETIYSTGDETVLEISSYLEPAQPYQYPLEHKELIYEDSPLNKILQILGIDNPSLSDLNDGFYLPSAENMVIFYLASPATLEIIDLTTNEKYLPNDPELQFIILGYPNQINNYLVKLSGTGDGEFNFHVGQYTSKGYFWQTYTEEITIGESIEYNFLFDPDLIIPDALVSENGYFHLIQAKKLLEDFNCPQAKKFIHQADQMINKKRWRLATIYLKNSIKQVSHCRKRLNDDNLVTYNISTEAMKQLAYSWEDILFHQNLSSKLLSRIQKKQAEKLLSVANQKFTTLNKYRFKPRILSAMSIKEAENILGFLSADFSNNAYFIIEPESYLAKTFVQEALTYNPTAKIK